MLSMYIYLMFLIMMHTHLPQSSLQLFSDSTQISTGFISIKTFCIKSIYHKCIYLTNTFIPQMHLWNKCIYHKCIYPTNAFIINAFIPPMHLFHKCIYHKCYKCIYPMDAFTINAFAINAF